MTALDPAGSIARLDLVAVSRIHRNQLQTLQQRTRIRNEFNMSALRAGENRVTRTLAIRRQTDSHELVALQFLLTAQTANSLLVRIVGNTTCYVDGWFHDSSPRTNREASDPNGAEANS